MYNGRVGGSNRGWASRGTKAQTFERVRWTGKVPFEIQDAHQRLHQEAQTQEMKQPFELKSVLAQSTAPEPMDAPSFVVPPIL